MTQRLDCCAGEMRARRWQSNTVSLRSVVSYIGVAYLSHSLRAMAKPLPVSAPTVLRDVRRGAFELDRLGMTIDHLLD